MESLYTIKLSEKFGHSEYSNMINDILRFSTIQIAIQIMLVLMDPDRFSLFSIEFMILLMFVIVGVMLYWMVIRKIVVFL